MRFSNFGALSQLFIIDAIQKHAERVGAAPAIPDSPMISGEAWKGVAREIAERFAANYDQAPPNWQALYSKYHAKRPLGELIAEDEAKAGKGQA